MHALELLLTLHEYSDRFLMQRCENDGISCIEGINHILMPYKRIRTTFDEYCSPFFIIQTILLKFILFKINIDDKESLIH